MRAMLLVAAIGLLMSSKAGAELYVGIYWDQAATTDTLVVSGPQSVSAYLVMQEDANGAGFVGYYGGFYMTSGVSLQHAECMAGEECNLTLEYLEGILPVVSFWYDCIPFSGTIVIGRLDFDVDPSQFPENGYGFVFPIQDNGPHTTVITYATTGCLMYFENPTTATPAFLVDVAVPIQRMSFGALRALYR